jgi:hypothetical protein
VVVISLQQKANKWSTLTRCVSSTYSKTERSPHQIQNSRDGRNQILEVRESHVLYKWRVTNHQAVPFLHINPPVMLCVNILKGLIPKPKPVHRICKSFGAILENQHRICCFESNELWSFRSTYQMTQTGSELWNTNFLTHSCQDLHIQKTDPKLLLL